MILLVPKCDGCNKEFLQHKAPNTGGSGFMQLRWSLKKLGWSSNSSSNDYCPACTKARIKKKEG